MANWRLRAALLGLLCCLPYASIILFSGRIPKLRTIAALVLTSLLVFLVLAYCARNWRRFFLLYTPFLLLSVAYAAYMLSYHMHPGHTLALIAVSASLEELLGLWTVWSAKWVVLPIAGLLGGYFILAWRLPREAIFPPERPFVGRVLVLLALPLALYAGTDSRYLMDGMALNPITGSVLFMAGDVPAARAGLHGAAVHKTPYHARRIESGEEVHVLVVGESARRGSWSVYGYARRTTPYLDAMRGEILLLQHAKADSNLTSYAVPMILSGLAPGEVLTAEPHGNLLDLAKEGGYSTTWLVNQDLDISTSIGITPDRLDYPPDPQAGFFGRHVPDDALLPVYRRELARSGGPRFIGMHIMQSHWEYYRRYPSSFQRFGVPGRLNSMSLLLKGGTIFPDLTDAYDNSVLYTDWFLKQVIDAAKALRVPVSVTFVPDHGECLPQLDGGAAGHGLSFYNAAQYEIPAFVWFNDAYRQAHPQRVSAVTLNASKEIRSHDFFYTVADLMGITWPQMNPERSFASASFVPDATNQYLVAGTLMSRP